MYISNIISLLLDAKLWTGNLGVSLSMEVIGKTRRRGVILDDVPYYIDWTDKISTKPRSKYRDITKKEYLKIIEKYDNDRVMTNNLINKNINDILIRCNIPLSDKQWYIDHMLLLTDPEVKDVTVAALPSNPHVVDVIINSFESLIDTLVATKNEHITLDISNGLKMVVHVVNDVPTGYITFDNVDHPHRLEYNRETKLRVVSPDPSQQLSIAYRNTLDLNNYKVKLNQSRSDVLAMIPYISDDIIHFQGAVDKAIDDCVSKSTAELGERMIFIKRGAMYDGNISLAEYYQTEGVPITLENIELVKDAEVVIYGKLPELTRRLISDLAKHVTSH